MDATRQQKLLQLKTNEEKRHHSVKLQQMTAQVRQWWTIFVGVPPPVRLKTTHTLADSSRFLHNAFLRAYSAERGAGHAITQILRWKKTHAELLRGSVYCSFIVQLHWLTHPPISIFCEES